VDLAENSQIVEAGLGVQQRLLVEWLSCVHLHFALHHVFAGMFGSRQHDLVDREAFAFLNGIGDVFEIGGLGGGFGNNFKRCVGKSVIEVIVQNALPIIRQILFGVGLARP